VSGPELFLLDRVVEFRGDTAAIIQFALANEELDEAAAIIAMCENAKELCGHDIARGFTSSEHLMKFILGTENAPTPIPIKPEDDGGVLACA
jgi:hypothetical protein